MESMTGYAFLEKSTEQFSYLIEIKSLNSKYLETFVNLPKILRNEESEINNIVKSYLNRGKIVLNIDIFDWTDKKPVSINTDIIVKYYQEIKAVHDELKIETPLDLHSILSLDGITQRERSVLSDKSKKDLYKSLDHVIKKLIDMRKKEGVSIKKDLNNSISEISDRIGIIKDLSKNVTKEKIESLKKRINQLADEKIDDSRLLAEVAILVDKLDINEEIVRLKDHIKKFKSILKESKKKKKKIDFIAQELFREINTIASKANTSDVSHHVVDVKNYIDKIREMSRNLM